MALNVLYIISGISCLAAVLPTPLAVPAATACTASTKLTLNFKTKTDDGIKTLETTIDGIKKTAPFLALINSVAYVWANDKNDPEDTYYGAAIPFPLPIDGFSDSSDDSTSGNTSKKDVLGKEMDELLDRMAKRMEEIAVENEEKPHDEKIHFEDDDKYNDLKNDYEKKQEEQEALAKEEGASSKESLEKEFTDGINTNGGQDGMVAIVLHMDNEAKFSSFFGGQRSGVNVAIAAAKSETGDTDHAVAAEGIQKLVGKIFPAGAKGSTFFLDGVNMFYGAISDLKAGAWGKIGIYLAKGLKLFGIEPPNIIEERPVLITSRDATQKELAKLQSYIDKIKNIYEKINNLEGKLGLDFVPEGLLD